MGSAAVKKTLEQLRKEIGELHRQQWEADRTDAEVRPSAKRRLSSSVVVKVEDGENAEVAEASKDAKKDLTAEETVETGAANQSDRKHSNLQGGQSRRDGNQKAAKTDSAASAPKHVPRVFPKDEDPSLVNWNKRMPGQLLGTLEMADANEPRACNITDVGASNETYGASGQGKPPIPPKVSETKTRVGRKRSMVWHHFTELKNEDPNAKRRAACNYCGIDYACDAKSNGTTSMLHHLEGQCKKYPFRNVDKTQTTLCFKPKQEGESSGALVATHLSVDACRQALAEMLILDELPFKFVESEGFQRFLFTVQPKWTTIPSRVTIAKDCYEVFLREKKKLKIALKGQRICLTTDTWTSVHNLNYMCLTAHFIDSEWKLHKRILNFCMVDNHKGETLGKVIETCLFEWGIDKILTLTVDNASSNNGVIQFLKRKTKNKPETILEHEFLHMRCCAHILNLIVREGLKEMDESIVRVRNAVRYVRSSPQRWKAFKLCAEKESISLKSQVCVDIPTRWNYTYLMLDRAEKFQKAFERLEEDDTNFLTGVRELGDDGDEEGTCRSVRRMLLGPPDSKDWKKIRLFVKFLQIFYDATLRFSGSNHVSCNSFFLELVTIQDTIEAECQEGDISLRLMAMNMKTKFQKYWGNFENMNALLYIGLVLDPRYKLRYVEFCFGTLYDKEKAKEMTKKVKDVFTRLFDCYVASETGTSVQEKGSQVVEGSSSGSSGSKDMRALRMSQFKKHLEEECSLDKKSEVKKYLAESCEEDVDGFELLSWWKINSARYRVLSTVARHVLAIPVSTVAFESAFSTVGCVLDPFRSSLAPCTVEALICAQNWLRSSSCQISLGDAMDDVEAIEKLQSELVEEVSSSDATSPFMEEDLS